MQPHQTSRTIWSRRRALIGAGVALGAVGLASVAGGQPRWTVRPRCRVIIDNDFSGDPDGLFQLAHQVLSPGSEIRLVIGSHLSPGRSWDPQPGQAQRAAARAGELLELMGAAGRWPVTAGAELPLASMDKPARTPAADAIIAEAMRTDSRLPLYYCAGAGLTDLATAWLLEPAIGRRLTLVWIGGPEYADLALPPPGIAPGPEYNLALDPIAAQVIFGLSDIPIWQAPRNAYRQMLVSYEELVRKVRPCGRVGDWLVARIEAVMAASVSRGDGIGETYILGDSPLVTLTALQSSFEADPSSSAYVVRSTPRISDRGGYIARPDGRPIRIYTHIDTRLTFDDMFVKLQAAFGRPAD
jgi:hypothetical protein